MVLLKEVGQSTDIHKTKVIRVNGETIDLQDLKKLQESKKIRLEKISETENSVEYRKKDLMFN